MMFVVGRFEEDDFVWLFFWCFWVKALHFLQLRTLQADFTSVLLVSTKYNLRAQHQNDQLVVGYPDTAGSNKTHRIAEDEAKQQRCWPEN